MAFREWTTLEMFPAADAECDKHQTHDSFRSSVVNPSSSEWQTPGWSRLWHESERAAVIHSWSVTSHLVLWGVRGLTGNGVSQFSGGVCDSCMSQIHIYSLADAFRPHFRCFNHWVCDLGNERFTLMLQAQGSRWSVRRTIGLSTVLKPDGQITHVFPAVPLPVFF